MKTKMALFIIFILFLIFAGIGLYLHFTYPTASPLISAQYKLSNLGRSHAQMQTQIVGFLPYWNLDNSKYLHFDLLSEIFFFSLTANENGEIIKIVKQETDPGWRWWNSPTIKNLIAKTQISGGKFGLTIAMQKNESLENFLDNTSAQKTLVNNLIQIVKSDKIDGLNLDFEYDGKPDDKYRDKFTDFAKELTSTFRTQSPKTELSIDFFPLSIQKPRLNDVATLAPLFDKVIVMSYDYYSGSSELAGPVAPINGYFFDVSTTYNDFLKVVPKEKIVMGIPYYGWDYPVEDNSIPLAKVLSQDDQNGYAEVISYGRARTDDNIKKANCQWEDKAQATWCAYTDSNNIQREAWIEDNKSIDIKFNFAKTNNLGGVAIWTLGYDKDFPDLWNLIKNYFTKI